MKKILGFICAALTATIGFASDTDTTETDGTNTDGATGTETQAETTETITAIGVNFCSGKGADTTKALFVSAWTNNTAYNGSSTVSGTIGLFDGSTVLSFSCKNTWTHTKQSSSDSESSSFLNGYLDDSDSGITISCTNIPFAFYDVVIYYASDGDTSKFSAPTVNGAQWTADTSNPSFAKKGSADWGSTAFNNGACTYGANVLRIVGLSGDLSIASSGSWNAGYRGSIAAIQIIKSNHGIFGFDFNSRANRSTNGTATFEASTVGELVPCANWVHCFNAPNSSTNFVSGTSSVSATWSCANVYSTANGRDSASDTTFIHGYLDDGSGVTIACTNIPFAKYDVVIYMATDADKKKFTAPTVNEKQYTYDSANPAKAKEGSDAFGDSNVHDSCAYGTNVLRVRDLTGNLTITSKAGGNSRGCIAAIQILASPETMTVGGAEATAKNWSETSVWQDNTAATNDLAEVDLQGDATVTLDTDLDLDQLTVRNAHKLTLKNADTAKAVSIDAIGLKDGATLAIADEALTNVINNAALCSALINDYATPSTLISRTYGNIYTQGAGESGSAKTINAQGGSITLSGADKPYYVNGGVSGTQTAVIFDGATIEYGNDDGLGVGQANYILSNATVKAKKFILSQGNDNRTATFTMNGSSSVTVTGNVNEDTNQSSIMFGHWKGPSTFTMNGTSTFTASNAQVLVGKTGYNQTININGGTLTAKGIKLAGNASGTNKLNLNGGTLALGEVGITSYSTSRTMAIAVGGDATIEATAATLPISQAMTVADGKTLTIKKASGNESENVAVTLSGAISGAGTIAFGAGVNVNLGTTRCNDMTIEVNSDTKVSMKLAYVGETIVFKGKNFKAENVTLCGTDGTTLADASVTVAGDGTVTVREGRPCFTASKTDANFADTTCWTTGTMPTSGDITILKTTTDDVTIAVPSACAFTNVYFQGEGKVGFKFADGATLNANGATMALQTSGLTLVIDGALNPNAEGTYKNTIAGAGKVETYGNVVMTKNSSFTGGITAKSGTLSTKEKMGFGGSSQATASVIVVEDGATLDLANTADVSYAVTITGKGVATTNEDGSVSYAGAIKNSGSSFTSDNRQTRTLTLAGDALIVVEKDKNFGLLAGGWGNVPLTMNNHTLTKQGEGSFFICNVTGTAGTIVVKEGTFEAIHTASTLTGTSVEMYAGTTFNAPVALTSSRLRLIPSSTKSVTTSGLGNYNGEVYVSYRQFLPSGTAMMKDTTYTLVTGDSSTVTNGFAIVDKHFTSLTYDENGTTLTASLTFPEKKFMHYDFNQESIAATNVASDSESNITSFADGSGATLTLSKRGKTGTSTKIVSGSTPYYSGISASKQFLYSGALSVTTVARVMCAPASGNKVILWGLGSVQPSADSGATSLILVAVDTNTVALVEGTSEARVVQEICRVTGIKNLTTEFHFFAIVIDGALATLYVDKLEPQTGTNIAKNLGQCGQFGSTFRGLPDGGYRAVDETGYYLDDWAVYDLALTADEVSALRKKYCPTPFMITAE